MLRSSIMVLSLFASSSVVPAQEANLQNARSAIMGQLDLLVASVEEKINAGGDLDPARYEMEYAAAMVASIPWLFPEPSEGEPQDEFSNAAPEIWMEFEAFVALNENARTLAEAVAFSDSPEDFREGFEALEAACAACHDKYVVNDY